MFFSIFIVGVDGISAKFAEVGFLLLYRGYFCWVFGKRGGGVTVVGLFQEHLLMGLSCEEVAKGASFSTSSKSL